MIKNRGLKLLCLLLPAMFFLAACESTTEIQILSDNTYTLHTQFTQPRSSQDSTCQDQIPGLADYENTPNITIIDKSTDEQFICDVTISAQSISQAKEPFVTIQHHGEYYRVTLKPVEGLDFLDRETDNFKLSISFPGPVLSAKSTADPQISGNTITWSDPIVLAQGFTVDGQDHAGMTLSTRIGLGVAILVLVAVIALVVFRKNARVAPIWAALSRFGHSVWRVSLGALGRLVTYLDLAHTTKKEGDRSGRHSRRGRRAREIKKAQLQPQVDSTQEDTTEDQAPTEPTKTTDAVTSAEEAETVDDNSSTPTEPDTTNQNPTTLKEARDLETPIVTVPGQPAGSETAEESADSIDTTDTADATSQPNQTSHDLETVDETISPDKPNDPDQADEDETHRH